MVIAPIFISLMSDYKLCREDMWGQSLHIPVISLHKQQVPQGVDQTTPHNMGWLYGL